MRKLIFSILTAIITIPCFTQQIDGQINEANHLKNICFVWQYNYLNNDKNISFININPVFFDNAYLSINTIKYFQRNIKRINIPYTIDTNSDEDSVGDFIANVIKLYFFFSHDLIMNKYPKGIIDKYLKEQDLYAKLYTN